MFDFGQAVEKISALFGQNVAVEELLGNELADRIGALDLDPSVLGGLPFDQLETLLADANIDPSALGEGQLTELLQSIAESGGPEGVDVAGLLDKIGQ